MEEDQRPATKLPTSSTLAVLSVPTTATSPAVVEAMSAAPGSQPRRLTMENKGQRASSFVVVSANLHLKSPGTLQAQSQQQNKSASFVSTSSKLGNAAHLFEVSGGGTFVEGPLHASTTIQYVFFIFVFIVARVSGWAPRVRAYNLIVFSATCSFANEIPRLLPRMAERKMRLYGSLLPLVVLSVISREIHDSLSVLYFCATMSITLQSGLPNLQIHAMVYICLFVAVYSLTVIFMIFFYVDQNNILPGVGLALQPQLSWARECTVLIALMLLGTAFLMFERYVHVYSHTILARKKVFRSLETQNRELNKEVEEIHVETQAMLDVESPLMKAIGTMKSLAGTLSVEKELRDKLVQLMSMLSQANKLYSPDLAGKVSDRDVGRFLEELLGGGEAKGGPIPEGRARDKRLLLDDGGKRQSARLDRAFISHDVDKQVQAILQKLEDWDFDVLVLQEVSCGHALYHVSTALFTRYGFSRKFGISEDVFRHFCWIVEEGYRRENAYHNSVHAADVLQCLNFFISSCGLARYMTDVDILASIIAALCHDIGHPGFNNSFHIATMHELAITYNDRAILENYHCARAFDIIENCGGDGNVLQSLTNAQYREARESIVTMILATDMAQHFDILSKFKAKLSTNGLARPDRAARLLIMSIAIKAADVSNPCRKSEMCRTWARRVMEEFFVQGDNEKKLALPVSAYMDRDRAWTTPKCQVGFIDFIVSPLFEVWTNFLPEQVQASVIMNYLRVNNEAWRSEVKDGPV